MNKDVVYIEPEDDITDIITKIENAKSKIVALVPPKKAGVFRSVVNIKLIAKAAASAEKTAVIVTADPSITKLAGAIKIPVAKNLQSAPSVPKFEENEEEVSKEELDDPNEEAAEANEDTPEVAGSTEDTDESTEEPDVKDDTSEETEDEPTKTADEKPSSKKSKETKARKSDNKFVQWFNEHKKPVLFGGIGGLVLIILLIWALVIAPAVKLTVTIKTELNNFSETVGFTTKLEEENASEGKFYLEERKTETNKQVEFEATGEKNVGAKAKGELIVYVYFEAKGSAPISAGTRFSINSLSFLADDTTSLNWGGDPSECGNSNLIVDGKIRCLISGKIKVTAAEPGEKYNVAASSAGWTTSASVAAYSESAMSGGTDEIIKVVSQADVDKAKNELASSENQTENEAALLEEIDDNLMAVDGSFSQITEDAVSTPAVGEKVEDGTKPTLTAKTITSIYIIDKTKIEEFITEKAKISDDQKIYEIRKPFIENFAKTDAGFAGKLKTAYTFGPKITENSVIEIVKGKGLGEAHHDLKDINGVKEVHIDPSFPWVNSVPNDPNKITVILEVEKQGESNQS